MNEQELNTRLEAIEKRLDALEGKEKIQIETKNKIKEDFSGLAGGIRLLIRNGFLNTPKDAKEIKEELKREGYHHEIAPISKMLSVNFTKNSKILNRVKEENIFKYVIRK